MRYLYFMLLVCGFSTAAFAQTETINLRATVYFSSASHDPSPEELAKLNDFATALTSYATYTLQIAAFTDEQGTAAYNADLARRRAEAVATALATRSVVATATEVLTYGEQLARTNTTEDAERRNDRRVDLLATVVRWKDAAAAIQEARKGQLQSFSVADPSARQTIRGENGGVFLLEPNSLIRPDGSPATGPVTMQLVEAYDLADMILAGLTTTSAGKRLVTGGMIRLTAQDADGTDLALKEGASLTASIPTDDFNERMRIFSGADHNEAGAPTDWALSPAGVAASPAALFAFNDQLPDISNFQIDAGKLIGPRLARWRQANPKPTAPSYLDPNSIRVKEPEAIDLEEVRYQPKGLKGLFMSKARKQAQAEALQAKTRKAYAKKVDRYQERLAFKDQLPEVNEAKRLDYEARLASWEAAFEQLKSGLLEDATRKLYLAAEQRIKAMRAAREARLAAMGEALAGLDDLTGNEITVRRYFFSVAKLGWTNVDIFASANDPVEVLASVPNSTREATVVLVPQDRRSVLAYVPDDNGAWKRSGVPRGVGYHILAYQVLHGQLMLAHQYVEQASEQPAALVYKPIAIAELKEKLTGILGS